MKIFRFMVRILAKINLRYNKIKEPKRFLIFITIILGPWFMLETIGFLINHKGFNVFGYCWLVIIMLNRIWWVFGDQVKHLTNEDLNKD